MFHFDSVLGDAMSRVANANYMLFSRDPKLAAVGFVWMPLPSFLVAPLLPLKYVWLPLVSRGFIANIESAVAMAATVVIVNSMLRGIGLARAPRLTIVVLLSLNPMFVYYGANGMSEPIMLVFLLGASAALARWARHNSTRDLVIAGTMLALAYLSRYEAIAAAVGAIGMVAVVAFVHAQGAGRQRVRRAIMDALVVGFPFVLTFVSWTLASWLIVGHPFDTFNSRYGNTAQVESARGGIEATVGATLLKASEYVFREMTALAPVLVPIFLVAAVVAWRRRDAWILAPISVLGGVMAFQALTTVKGQSFGWLRFQITAIPLSALLLGYLLAPAWHNVRHGLSIVRNTKPRWRSPAAALLACVVMGGAIVTTLAAWSDPALGREERTHLLPVWNELTGRKSFDHQALGDFDGERAVAAYVDALHPGDGSVLLDVALGFPIVLASKHPKQFVITSDRDFPDAIADPVAAGVRYILVSKNTGTMDAIVAVYPNIFKNGAGFAHLVREFSAPNGNGRTWRLFEIGPLHGEKNA